MVVSHCFLLFFPSRPTDLLFILPFIFSHWYYSLSLLESPHTVFNFRIHFPCKFTHALTIPVLFSRFCYILPFSIRFLFLCYPFLSLPWVQWWPFAAMVTAWICQMNQKRVYSPSGIMTGPCSVEWQCNAVSTFLPPRSLHCFPFALSSIRIHSFAFHFFILHKTSPTDIVACHCNSVNLLMNQNSDNSPSNIITGPCSIEWQWNVDSRFPTSFPLLTIYSHCPFFNFSSLCHSPFLHALPDSPSDFFPLSL